MEPFARIAFLTDYGLEDAFIGICHGVIDHRAPDVRVIDLSHRVPMGDVLRGALLLESAAPDLAPAVFIAVVDPGVGTDRRALAIQAGDSILIGPDNGLLLPAADRLGGVGQAVEISDSPLRPRTVSHTFHGRDLFAPVGAAIAAGAEFDSSGEQIDPGSLVRLEIPGAVVSAGRIEATVLVEDGFGNLTLGVDRAAVSEAGFVPGDLLEVGSGEGSGRRLPFVRAFGEVPEGEPLLFVDSTDRLAIGVNLGSAARLLGLEPGREVVVSSSGQGADG